MLLVPRDPEISEHQDIHLGAEETVERFFRIADNRFVFAKRSVAHKRDAGEVAEMFDQAIIARDWFLCEPSAIGQYNRHG
jgi:hypothetical protein